MSVFYLQHKKHGTKVATDEAEYEADKKIGWVDYDPYAASKKPRKEQGESPQTQEKAFL